MAEEETASEGSYVVTAADGTYVGESRNIDARLAQHVVSGKFTQAETEGAERITVTGGRVSREVAEQEKIDELGGMDNLLNRHNPIGPRRFELMPQPYSRP